jgi:hypothetical protein
MVWRKRGVVVGAVVSGWCTSANNTDVPRGTPGRPDLSLTFVPRHGTLAVRYAGLELTEL